MTLSFLALLPLHEHIHAASYRLFGAPSARVHYRMRTLSAYCVADQYVIGGVPFMVVCLAPCVVLTLLLVCAIAGAEPLRAVLSGMLLLHTGACSGDVALANVVWAQRPRRVWTYDATADMATYFFVERVPRCSN